MSLNNLPAALCSGIELRVTDALPFDACNKDGEPIGPVHWFPMYDYVLVSRELWEQLKESDAADKTHLPVPTCAEQTGK